MQAEIELKPIGKPKSFYQRHILPALRRLLHGKQQSVWDVDLDDEMGEDDASWISGSIFITVILLGIAQALFILLPVAYIVQLVFVVPGGLPAVIGHQLAEVCLGGGSCDVGQLLASYGFAVIFLVNAVGLIAYGVLSGAGLFDRTNPNDVPLALGVIDERVKELHDELITAKVLPMRIEADDD
jgi:hypothetical protein